MSSSTFLKSFSEYEEFTKQFPCDVTFLVGPDIKELKGHKPTLAAASTVMRNKFLESNETVLSFENLNVDGFKLMLLYIFKRKITLESEVEAVRLLQVAKYFQIQELLDKAVDKLTGIINNVTCLPKLLSEALTLEIPELKNFVLDCICWKGKEVIESEEFLQLAVEEIGIILGNENLQVATEISVFDAALRWAEHKIVEKKQNVTCERIRAELGRALYSIRIPLLPTTYYVTDIIQNENRKNIFTTEELFEIFTYFLSMNIELEDERRSRITTRFPSTPRKQMSEAPTLNRILFQCNDGSDFESTADYEPPSKVPRIPKDELESKDSDYEPLQFIYSQSKGDDESNNDSDSESCSFRSEKQENNSTSIPRKFKSKNNPDFLQLYDECKMKLQTNPECDEITFQEPYIIKPGKLDSFTGEQLYFPSLKTFNVQYLLHVNNPTSFKKYLGSLSASNLIFVTTQLRTRRNFLEAISGIKYAEIQINRATVLKIDKDTGTLIVSRIDPEEILDGIKDWKHLRHINLEFIQLPSLDILPTQNLQSLTLKNVTGFQGHTDYAKFLASCPKLEEFSLDDFGFKGEHGLKKEFDPNTCLNLGDLGSLCNLRKLSVGKVRLNYSKKDVIHTFPNLKELYISDKSNWNIYLEEIAPKIFPNLKKAQVSVNCVNVELVAQLLKINSLVWLSIWEVGLNDKTYKMTKGRKRKFPPSSQKTQTFVDAVKCVKKILTDAGETESEASKTILLHRNLPSDPWMCKNLRGKGKDPSGQFREWSYGQLNWSVFYKNYDHYKQANGIVSKE